MAPRSWMAVADQALEGRLAEVLTQLRAEGLTFDEVAIRLRSDHGLDFSRETLRRWLKELVPDGAADAKAS